MEKKYQFFVSSTYEDLKEERSKAIQTILTMNQFPVGMEMFSAADDDQWKIIQEAIDSSDYYVLIIGNKYGSIEETSGISYTEKEFDYAVDKEIPVLAFIADMSLNISVSKFENDPLKIEKLNLFKKKVKESGRYVVFWKNIDNLEALLSQSIAKAIARGNRPGWVRTTEFDIDKSYGEILRLTKRVHTLEALNSDLRLENNRKPVFEITIHPDYLNYENPVSNDVTSIKNGIHLNVSPINLTDVENGLDYKDYIGNAIHAEKEEVKLTRHIYKNSFPVYFNLKNIGDCRATGVRLKLNFPDELLVLSGQELLDYYDKDMIIFSENAYDGWDLRFYSPNEPDYSDQKDKFISLDELTTVNDIANLLDPADLSEGVSILPGEVIFESDEIKHKDHKFVSGMCILPTSEGQFEIECDIICNEFPDAVHTKIIVEVS